jgi:hypothetical protein
LIEKTVRHLSFSSAFPPCTGLTDQQRNYKICSETYWDDKQSDYMPNLNY